MQASGCLSVWCIDVVSVCKLRQPVFQASIFHPLERLKYLNNSFLLVGHWENGCQCKDRTIVFAYGNKNINVKLMVTGLSTGICVHVRKDSLFSLGNKTYLKGTKNYMISVSV